MNLLCQSATESQRRFGIAGAASIIRFRTPIEDARDITILFILMGLGMAAGVGGFAVAGLGTLFLCAMLPALNLFLYETAFDATLRNLSLRDGEPPPLWLVLKFLLTAFDRDERSDSAAAHELLGSGMSALHELNFLHLDPLVAPDVRIDLAGDPAVQARELEREIPGEHEDIAAVWAAAAEVARATDAILDGEDAFPGVGFFERRDVAKQTARGLGEQEDSVKKLAAVVARQGTGIASVAQAADEQSAAVEQIARALVQMRGQTREVASTLAAQAKGAAAMSADVSGVADGVARMRARRGTGKRSAPEPVEDTSEPEQA